MLRQPNRPAKYACSTKNDLSAGLRSKALQVNLEVTDRIVTIDPKYLPLEEVVETLPGLLQQTQGFLCELNHPFKNWEYVVRELRNYALRNFSIYYEHPRGPQVVRVVFDEWLDALSSSPDPAVHDNALDNIVCFAERILLDGKRRLGEYMPILSELFGRLLQLPDEQFFLLACGYYQIKRIGEIAMEQGEKEFDLVRFNLLLGRALQTSYQYWLAQEDPLGWFVTDTLRSHQKQRHEALFAKISHDYLRRCMERLERIDSEASAKTALKQLLMIPDYGDIVRSYKELPYKIKVGKTDSREGLAIKFQCLLKIIETKGLSAIHEDTLGRINRNLAAIIHSQKDDKIDDLVAKTFEALRRSMRKFPEAALQALENIGREIFKSNDSDLVDSFIQHTIDSGFQYPEIKGTTTEWKVEVNPAHLANVKAWLHIIENDPKWCKRLISALIIHLKLSGLYIKDTDLFQKELSFFLNSDIAPVYNLAKQLTKLFPVYFNEINAEGELRDVSTEIDELSTRGDVLIHFLRKQSHVESNNLLLGFALAIIDFWSTKDKGHLVPYVPIEVLDTIQDKGPFVTGVHRVVTSLFQKAAVQDSREILDLDMISLTEHLSEVPEKLAVDSKRVSLLLRFLHLLDQKYNLLHFETDSLVKEAAAKGLPGTKNLEKTLRNPNTVARLQGILDYLKLLKQIILSPEQFEISEDIYRKRHIAADIPSMYGTYKERKFDALGFSFRLENLANVLFEELIGSINLNFLTRTTIIQIVDCMHLLFQAMELDGIVVKPLKHCLNLLAHAIEVRRFSFTQYLDIFGEFSRAEQHILNAHYTSIHEKNLAPIIRMTGAERLLPKFGIGKDEKVSQEVVSKVSEAFFRDVVATTFGFQYLDNFVSKVIYTLWRQSEELSGPNLDLLLSYDPAKVLSGVRKPLHATRDPITLGTKGYNLVRLSKLKMPAPDGFIITTEVFRCLKAISAFGKADEDLREKILSNIKQLEKQTKRQFGHVNNPLLLSVRSGAAISLPGMMTTFLNVGLNEKITEGLVKRTGKPWFAWDNYRRFLQSWGMSYNMERDVFDAVMNAYKGKYGIDHKRAFSPEQMREVALSYRETLIDSGIRLKDDPYEQLFQAIRQVFYSWDSDKAKTYRDIMGISDDWGTAVIVQNMVFGNLHERAGSGVVFTHNPHAPLDKVSLWGDYTAGNQGEDVVSGLVRTHAISREQKSVEGRDQDEAMEEVFPEIFGALREIAKALVYEEGWGPQEIEFTFEGETADKLFLLQSRDMVVSHGKSHPVFVPSPKLKASALVRGIGVSGGALCGRVVFTLEEISRFRSLEPNTSLILVRFDTVPDDIREISAADGLLTSRGGATSHASIVAHQLEKTCVVGCSNLMVDEKAGRGTVNGHTIQSGDYLSIDGRNGFVYKGKHETTIQSGGVPA
jgi:pyruvate,orthophosphate dikinase